MRALYQKAYKRLLGRLIGSQEAGKIELPATLTSYSHDILHRIPRDDFKLVIKVPCTVKDPQAENETVQAFKRLRAHAHIEQGKVCFKCPHRLTCPVAGRAPTKFPADTAVQDMVAFYGGLNGLDDASANYRVWNAAYKTVDSFGVIVEDLKEDGNEHKLYDADRLKHSEERVNTEAKEKVGKPTSTKTKPPREEVEEEEQEPRERPKARESRPPKFERNENPRSDNRQQKGSWRDNNQSSGDWKQKGERKTRQQFQDFKPRDGQKGRDQSEFSFTKFNRDDPIRPRKNDFNSDNKGRNHSKFSDDQSRFERNTYREGSGRSAGRKDDFFADEGRERGGFVRNDGPRMERQPRNDNSFSRDQPRSESFSPRAAPRAPPSRFEQQSEKKSMDNLYTKFSSSTKQEEGPKEERAGRRVRGRPRI